MAPRTATLVGWGVMLVDVERGGRRYKVQVPDDAPKHLWNAGIVIGPPDLTLLNLPKEIETRLHNELHARGIITQKDARKRTQDVHGALQSALRLDAQRIVELYL